MNASWFAEPVSEFPAGLLINRADQLGLAGKAISVTDVKTHKLSCRCPGRHHGLANELSHAAGDLFEHQVDLRRFPLDDQFNPSIVQVSHEARYLESARNPMGRVAETDSLHMPGIKDPPPFHGPIVSLTKPPLRLPEYGTK